MDALSGGTNLSSSRGARDVESPRAPPSLELGVHAQGREARGGARVSQSEEHVLEGPARGAEGRGGEVWIWGGAIRFPSLRPPYDGTLGLTLFGSLGLLVCNSA